MQRRAKISANNAAKSVSLLYFQVCCLANKKVAEEISLRHASNILFLIIQYRDSGIAMYHKPFQSLTNRILFIKKYSGDFGES